MTLDISYNPTSRGVTILCNDGQSANLFFKACLRKGFQFGVKILFMKMETTFPTLAEAMRHYGILGYGGEIKISLADQGNPQQIVNQLRNITNDINNPPTNDVNNTQHKPWPGIHLNFYDGIKLLAISTLLTLAVNWVLRYIASKIREYKPNPLYIYGGFIAGLGTLYALGTVPLIIPNLLAFGVSHLTNKFLNPHIENMEDGKLKTISNFTSSSAPIIASGLAATGLYSSVTRSVISTSGIVIGTHVATLLPVSWEEKAKGTSKKELSLGL